ncbi:uncharacterized protein F5147DRAFT_782871 [Suillus discolor]|uniref:Uncharacterized protein n=1 Tax=Suillus discolor TaxID=1912936 RepID=A0A9P7JL30_9AGAM|nr:uncharacterized protein F5147DRAFT_782871 [Suillus discolor]KAG2083549.1 hypothetical protein F5147DRAFT_782871 [Suillus discolor]
MPPARREHVRHSAHLKPNTPLHLRAMDDASTSRGPPKPPESSGPWLAIQWQSDHALTDTLVNYLTTQAADCRVLFYSDGKKAMAAVDDHPSWLDKGQIYQNIAKLLFAGHPKYGAAYAINSKKFCDAVGNCIGTLRGKYKKLKNLLDAALLKLPWYTELDSIWHSNPSIAAVTHSSKPGVDHASVSYSLVQPHDGAGPSAHFDATSQWSPYTPTYPSHDTHSYSSSTPPSQYGQPYSLGPHIPYHANALETPHAGSSQFAPAPSPAPAPALLTPASAPTLAPAPAPSHTAPYNTSPQFHLHGLPTPKDALNNHNADDDDFDQDISGPFDTPLGDSLNYLKDDDMMVDKTTDSPSHVAGKKQQLPSLPLPPPNAPEPFHRPAKSPMSSYNNCSVLGIQKLLSCGGRCK